jgi:predicted  nucleic acid-binding Zn-ribbon protein
MNRTAFVATFVLLFAAAAMIGRAQQTALPPDILSALLIEVRGLRAALEQTATAGPSVQLALGRVQLQEQRIVNQARRYDSVRATLFAAQTELAPLERKATDLEEIIRDFPSSEGRPDAEKELAQVKGELARRRTEVQRLTAEESVLAQDISAEQNRWNDFNQQLEKLERMLGRR